MHWITRMPHSTSLSPSSPNISQSVVRGNDHVKRVPEFVG
jgi:hypothetical protein